MSDPGILTIVPPLAAIAVALWRKNALLALAFGLWLTYFLASDFSPVQSVTGTLNGLWETVSSTGNLRIIIYSLLVGSLLVVIERSGGLNAFVDRVTGRNWVNSPKKAALVPTTIGSFIFTDTNLSLFSAGMASQTLFERFQMSRARLAYLIDSTCAPISVLILINGWGAYILGLLEGQNVENGVGVLIDTIVFNFYALIAVTLAYYTAISGRVYGPMKHSALYSDNVDEQSSEQSAKAYPSSKSRYFFLPLAVMIALTFVLLWWTGDGDIRKGSGSLSVLWAVIASFVLLIIMVLSNKAMTAKAVAVASFDGFKNMAVVVGILILSFAFGDAVKAYGTGIYVSSLMSTDLPLLTIAPVIFLTAAAMAFATGSSWSTFAVLIPIAIPTAAATGLPPAFLVAAVLGGGIFGDHASPISDTTVVASLASKCDHIEHVKTQLPYALFGGILAIVLYVIVGMFYL